MSRMGIVAWALGALMGMASSAGSPLIIEDEAGRIPRGFFRRMSRRKAAFDPRVNRWTGKPHEHKREIARNLKRNKAHA